MLDTAVSLPFSQVYLLLCHRVCVPCACLLLVLVLGVGHLSNFVFLIARWVYMCNNLFQLIWGLVVDDKVLNLLRTFM